MSQKQVSFIASREGFLEGGYDDDLPNPSNVDDPSFIAEVYAKLTGPAVGAVQVGDDITAATAPDHMLVRIASLDDMATWLAAYFGSIPPPLFKDKDKLKIQIIGHSSSGSLALGSSWGDPPAASSQYRQLTQAPYKTLSSTPTALLLLAPYVEKIQEVRLAGCYVGLWQTNGFPVNGRTLMFTLAEMWHCKVRGALGAVEPKHFDTGWFEGPQLGWSWVGARPTVAEEQPFALQPDSKKLTQPDSIGVTGGPTLTGPDAEALTSYFDGCIPMGDSSVTPRLAVKELLLQLNYPGGSRAASLMCGGMFLAVDTDEGRVFYCNKKLESSVNVGRIIRSLRQTNSHAQQFT